MEIIYSSPRIVPTDNEYMFELHRMGLNPLVSYEGTVNIYQGIRHTLAETWDSAIRKALIKIHGVPNTDKGCLEGAMFPHQNDHNWELYYIDNHYKKHLVRTFIAEQ